jgi:hypothetical protein
MAEQELVSQERFDDFKSEVLRAINEVKDTLGSRISELTGEIKAYSQVAQIQSNQHKLNPYRKLMKNMKINLKNKV